MGIRGLASQTDPGANYAPITPHDSTNFTNGVCRGIYVGVAGIIVAVTEDDVAVTFKGAAAGTIIPIRAKRVNSTTTTATDMVAIY